jgi:hypothetical protein
MFAYILQLIAFFQKDIFITGDIYIQYIKIGYLKPKKYWYDNRVKRTRKHLIFQPKKY